MNEEKKLVKRALLQLKAALLESSPVIKDQLIKNTRLTLAELAHYYEVT